MSDLTHLDNEGSAIMVDVGHKPPQARIARAAGRIRMAKATLELIRNDKIKKGSVLTITEIAGIQAAKRTSDLIPLCHPLPITKIRVKAMLQKDAVTVTSEVACVGKTGVEMEALTAVSVALLTVYDMCKAVDKNMVLEEVKLLEKTKTDLPKPT